METTDTEAPGRKTESTMDETPEMTEADIAHLAGFFDGVGTLTVYITENDDYGHGYLMRPTCRITRPVRDEDPIMGKVAAYCDEHYVTYNIRKYKHDEDTENSSYRFELKKAEDIRRFIEPLQPYLISKLRQSVIMLDDIIPAVKNGEHFEKEGFLKLMRPADQIRSLSNHQSRVKYDEDYFREKWSLPE